MTDQPNFETRVTEAEERALEAVEALRRLLAEVSERNDASYEADRALAGCAASIQTAAALARDYARKEG